MTEPKNEAGEEEVARERDEVIRRMLNTVVFFALARCASSRENSAVPPSSCR